MNQAEKRDAITPKMRIDWDLLSMVETTAVELGYEPPKHSAYELEKNVVSYTWVYGDLDAEFGLLIGGTNAFAKWYLHSKYPAAQIEGQGDLHHESEITPLIKTLVEFGARAGLMKKMLDNSEPGS